jgi:hypothetical protein
MMFCLPKWDIKMLFVMIFLPLHTSSSTGGEGGVPYLQKPLSHLEMFSSTRKVIQDFQSCPCWLFSCEMWRSHDASELGGEELAVGALFASGHQSPTVNLELDPLKKSAT